MRSVPTVTPDARPKTPDAPQGGRCLAIGDIHGCFDALTTLEAFVPFEADDCLVTLGDYTSRGPDSRKVLDWLIARMALPKTDRAAATRSRDPPVRARNSNGPGSRAMPWVGGVAGESRDHDAASA